MRLQLILSFVFFQFIISSSVISSTKSEEKIPKTPVKMSVSLYHENKENYLVLSYVNHPHWHTYWKNPGDAGLPLKFKFSIKDEEQTYEELEWPIPQKYIEEGNMLAYGYEGSYSLFFKLNQNQLKKLQNHKLKIKSSWLVCKHICIPGKKEYIVELKNQKLLSSKPKDFEISDDILQNRKELLPKLVEFPKDLDLNLTKRAGNEESALTLYSVLTSKGKKNLLPTLGLLTPFPKSPFSFKHEKLFLDKSRNLYQKMDIDWDGEYTQPELPFPKDGIFKARYKLRFLYNNPLSKKIEIIEKEFGKFSLDSAKQFENFFTSLNIKEINKEKNSQSPNQQTNTEMDANLAGQTQKTHNSFLYYLIFGLIGGLILNFMPCVLPVISIKLFGMIKHQGQSQKKILLHNISYTTGVLFAFIVFATIVTLLKSTGESVGWGFQLQSPIFISTMILVLFIFTLNLFGLFEFKTPGGNKLGGLQLEDGPTGDFFSGILATILSTPCSAPFLGTALTFAFTEGTVAIYSIFLSIGLGLSLPFIITGIFPSLVAFLPRPGAWMENLKKVLGLSLIMTMIWLMDVYSSQVETSLSVLKLNSALAIIFFLFYMRKSMSKKLIYSLPFLVLGSLLFYSTLTGHNIDQTTKDDLLKDKSKHGIVWEKWSPQKLEEKQLNKDLVFIDFTAKWCFTCKVNERLVLETDGFRKLVKKYNVKLLLGDWTKRDATIGQWLKSQGMVGVPAYFVQKPDGTIHNLGETITLSKIEKYLLM